MDKNYKLDHYANISDEIAVINGTVTGIWRDATIEAKNIRFIWWCIYCSPPVLS